jgi:hypothetical protein
LRAPAGEIVSLNTLYGNMADRQFSPVPVSVLSEFRRTLEF